MIAIVDVLNILIVEINILMAENCRKKEKCIIIRRMKGER